MSTPLADRINALTALANEKTGAEDTTLTEAVGRLIDGYGGDFSELVKSRIADATYTNNDAPLRKWLTYVGLSEQDVITDGMYMLEFLNNGTSANHVRFALYSPSGTSIKSVFIGAKGAIVANDLTTWANVNKDTVINAYRIRTA